MTTTSKSPLDMIIPRISKTNDMERIEDIDVDIDVDIDIHI